MNEIISGIRENISRVEGLVYEAGRAYSVGQKAEAVGGLIIASAELQEILYAVDGLRIAVDFALVDEEEGESDE
ncbi:hypothetical protein LCGC14_2832040 [marine sediment metagenome]|uniref:Uncharacterized protein n=1 Tax=marine sediment metagenome TaxID=412755 RepID=A0A0F8YDT7_9ZZZZ